MTNTSPMAPGREPTDEELATVMHEACELAIQRKKQSDQWVRDQLAKGAQEAMERRNNHNHTQEAKNMTLPNSLLKDVLALTSVSRAELVDLLFDTLDQPDPSLDALWLKEVEDRIEAYERGEIKAIPVQEVMARYRSE